MSSGQASESGNSQRGLGRSRSKFSPRLIGPWPHQAVVRPDPKGAPVTKTFCFSCAEAAAEQGRGGQGTQGGIVHAVLDAPQGGIGSMASADNRRPGNPCSGSRDATENHLAEQFCFRAPNFFAFTLTPISNSDNRCRPCRMFDNPKRGGIFGWHRPQD